MFGTCDQTSSPEQQAGRELSPLGLGTCFPGPLLATRHVDQKSNFLAWSPPSGTTVPKGTWGEKDVWGVSNAAEDMVLTTEELDGELSKNSRTSLGVLQALPGL